MVSPSSFISRKSTVFGKAAASYSTMGSATMRPRSSLVQSSETEPLAVLSKPDLSRLSCEFHAVPEHALTRRILTLGGLAVEDWRQRAERYRNRAEEMRALAESMHLKDVRNGLMQVASQYDAMAATADRQGEAVDKQTTPPTH